MNEQDQMMLEYMMSQGAQVPEQDQIKRQQMMLARLRQHSQMPQGEYTQTGGGQPAIYVAPNPLQNLASIVGQGVTGYGENELNKRSTEMGQSNVNAFADLVKRLRGKSASANMGSSGNTLTTDRNDYGGSL